MSFVRTLTGDIAPADLGVTYAHDHLYCVPPFWKEKGDVDLIIDDIEASIKDVELFKSAGGQSIYDATTLDYGRDPVALRTISERTGIRIIIARRTMYRNYGEGGLGLAYILKSWVPRFVDEADEAGFNGQALIKTFMIDNPQRAFAFKN